MVNCMNMLARFGGSLVAHHLGRSTNSREQQNAVLALGFVHMVGHRLCHKEPEALSMN